MPLSHLDLEMAILLTDAGLVHLRGMPLTSLNLENCIRVEGRGLASLQGAPLSYLKDLNLKGCQALTDSGLVNLRGLPLTALNLASCFLLTGPCLEVSREEEIGVWWWCGVWGAGV